MGRLEAAQGVGVTVGEGALGAERGDDGLDVGGGRRLVAGGLDVVVVGRGVTVGRSIGLLLTRREVNATVTLTHTGTTDVAAHTRAADVVIAAAGVPSILTADMVRPGAVVVDVGVSRVTDAVTGKSRVAGDVDPSVREVAAWVSPNPGGVGPMTRAMLLANVVEAAERSAGT